MHAFLIIGGNKDAIEKELSSRINTWKISPWDTIRIPKEGTVGIEMIRDFEQELILIPRNSPAKVGLLTDIDRLTQEAQNALLKTLEEPPPHTYIIGTTAIPEALLPTILSRMTIIMNINTTKMYDTALLLQLLRASPGKILATLEPYLTTREDAKKLVGDLLGAAQQELLTHPTPHLTKLIRNLLEAQTQLSVNVNQKLVVDNAILHFI